MLQCVPIEQSVCMYLVYRGSYSVHYNRRRHFTIIDLVLLFWNKKIHGPKVYRKTFSDR